MGHADQPGHVVLLGDSIFDNGAYVPGSPDVIVQLRSRLPRGWKAGLLAVDGATVSGVERQLGGLPPDATHLVVSAGGNDALGASSILGERVGSVGEAVARLASAQQAFAAAYDRMLSAVQRCGLPTSLCTIYDANYPHPQRQIIISALALFNDVITRAAFRRGWPLIDLRLICDSPEDYANPIEPSERGGDKIASAIVYALEPSPAEDRSFVIASA
jgi:hypothetical protein